MCDYSLHAVASRPAKVGETLITTTFRGTPTRGFASESEPAVAVCMLPGTELAFAEDVKYNNRWLWTKAINFRVGKFGAIEPLQRLLKHSRPQRLLRFENSDCPLEMNCTYRSSSG
jgi:hypothetical protein